jgi:hypothetical protein
MEAIRSLVVCVEYDDMLAVTLKRNARHFTEVLVVTHPGDKRTRDVVADVPSASCLLTDAFYRHDAKFNKGLAIEEGFDRLGREGWLCVWDADTLLPSDFAPPRLTIGKLYSAKRRMLENMEEKYKWYFADERSWRQLPYCADRVFAGYFHLFNAADPVLEEHPWYDVTFTHAGGGDGYFQSRWSNSDKLMLPFDVLHIGPRDRNWFGRTTRRIDGLDAYVPVQRTYDMQEYARKKGWLKSAPLLGSDRRVIEHIYVPGQRSSGFKP